MATTVERISQKAMAIVARAKKKIGRYRKHGCTGQLARFLASWRGHAQWANTHNLLTRLEVTA